ncbi:MAG: branched-chain-amino-acid transaminase [Nitrospirae bacterium]|nr:branched-chain-amino-acid transaminase [Nitrospirota bacterium]
MEKLVYLNGSLVPESEAKVSIFDRGFLYGDGLFETMRVYSGKVFRLERHLQRLFHAAGIIALPISRDEKELREAIYQTLQANHLQEAYLRLTISRGEGGTGPDIPEKVGVNMVIVAKPLPLYPRSWYEEGVKAAIVDVRRDEASSLSRIKSLNYLPNILARLEARDKGAEEGIMLNSQGCLAEGTVSNLFIISQGKVVTPSVESGILPGITREAILELVPRQGWEISERRVNLSELREAEEAFLTNSLREVVPLTRVDGRPVGEGKPGKITGTIAVAYTELVKKETQP